MSTDSELWEFFGEIEEPVAPDEIEIDMECTHGDIYDSDGINICKLCGCQIEVLDFQPEWRYYGTSDTRSVSNPSRCHHFKEVTRGGIAKVFQDAKLDSLPLILKNKTENKYKRIVGNETVRGKGRKAIVAACLLYTFYDEGDYKTSDDVRNMFKISKEEMSSGLAKYYKCFPSDRRRIIRPVDMIRKTLKDAKMNIEEHYKPIARIANLLENSDPLIKRSNPQSVAAAIVYLYICMNPTLKEEMGVNKTKFARDVKLSDITISKLVKKAAEVLNLEVTL